MRNAGDPVPFNPPVPSIPLMIDAYYHVGFGLTLNNYPIPNTSKEMKTNISAFLYIIKLALSPDWFLKKTFFDAMTKIFCKLLSKRNKIPERSSDNRYFLDFWNFFHL